MSISFTIKLARRNEYYDDANDETEFVDEHLATFELGNARVFRSICTKDESGITIDEYGHKELTETEFTNWLRPIARDKQWIYSIMKFIHGEFETDSEGGLYVEVTWG